LVDLRNLRGVEVPRSGSRGTDAPLGGFDVAGGAVDARIELGQGLVDGFNDLRKRVGKFGTDLADGGLRFFERLAERGLLNFKLLQRCTVGTDGVG